METLTFAAPALLPAGEIVATGVSFEDYMARYALTFHEWIRGVVIQISPASRVHDALTIYLRQWLNIYFELNPIGQALNAPFVMSVEAIGSGREPDVQVILNSNPGQLTDTRMIGPADICIEVVSPESVARDYGDKFLEYEKAGIREYWIVDPLRQRCDFNRLDESGVYVVVPLDETESYRTPLLPQMALHVPTLWLEELPGVLATTQVILKMMESA